MFFFFFSTGLTVMYSFRLISFCLKNFLGFVIMNMNEDMFKLLPMMILLGFSVVGGSFLMWLIFPFMNLILLGSWLKMVTIIICFVGGLLGYLLFNNFNFVFLFFNFLKLNYYLSFMWFMPIMFCFFFNYFFLKLINNYKVYFDLGWMEYFGGLFFKNLYFYFVLFFYKFNFYNYFFMSLIFMIIFL